MGARRPLEHWGVAWRPKVWLQQLDPAVSVRAASKAAGVSDTIVHNWDSAGFAPLAFYKLCVVQFWPGSKPPKQPPKFIKADLPFRLALPTWEAAEQFDTRFPDSTLPKNPPLPEPSDEPFVPKQGRPKPRVSFRFPAVIGGSVPESEADVLLMLLSRIVVQRDDLQRQVSELQQLLDRQTAPVVPKSKVEPPVPIADPIWEAVKARLEKIPALQAELNAFPRQAAA
jgi:hypothetical protein